MRRRRIDPVAAGALTAIAAGGYLMIYGTPEGPAGHWRSALLLASGATTAAGSVMLLFDRQRHAALATVPLAVVAPITLAVDSPYQTLWFAAYPVAVGAALYAVFASRPLRIDPVALAALLLIQAGSYLMYVGLVDSVSLFGSVSEHEMRLMHEARPRVYWSGAVVALGTALLLLDRKPGPALATVPLAVGPPALIALGANGLLPLAVLLAAAPVAVGAGIKAMFSLARHFA